MATSLAVPIAYITVLVTSLAIFSRIYRRRRAAEKTSFEPWFPAHPARDIYITLLSADPPVPDSMLKSALLVRATADVKRIWRIKDDKQTLAGLHQRGLIGDDTMARFAAAEKELEAEIVDVVSEANTFRNGWGTMIFATASEMARAENTRDTVLSIGKARAQEERKLHLRAKLLGLPLQEMELPVGGGAPAAPSVGGAGGPSPAGAPGVGAPPPELAAALQAAAQAQAAGQPIPPQLANMLKNMPPGAIPSPPTSHPASGQHSPSGTASPAGKKSKGKKK